ncbi:glycosyltransferase family 2 protein [Humibacter sp. BT305]|nr:glycosyltransferase family 2 protein [Humibacter sp. BT305]
MGARWRGSSSSELARTAQWSHTTIVRDELARRASRGRLDYAGLLDSLAAGPVDLDRGSGVALAESVERQARDERDHLAASQLFRSSVARGEVVLLDPEAQSAMIAALLGSGHHDDAASMLSLLHGVPVEELRQIAADVLNPWTRPDGGDHARWRAAFSSVFTEAGYDAPELEGDAGRHPFDRLRSPELPSVSGPDDPLVSVVMTCHRPGVEAFTAVASVLAQTWQRLELIIVDDGSPADYRRTLAALGRRDPRIRILHRSTNAGTYTCRNLALRAARGEFVTTHDSDDWMHPRRLETQVRHLQQTPDAPSNSTHALRITDELSFTQPRGYLVRLCEPSLMFRRRLIADRVGAFDAVRKGADTEFRRRIAAVFDRPSDILLPGVPLTLQRWRSASLTGEEIGPRWLSPSRIAYASAYASWHRAIAAGAADPRSERTSAARPFPAPADILSSEVAEIVPPVLDPQVDLLFVVDLVERIGDARSFDRLAHRIRQEVRSGRRVGVAHAWSAGPEPLLPLHYVPAMQALFDDGVATLVLTGAEAGAGVAYVIDAATLQDPADLPWRIGRIVRARSIPRPLRLSSSPDVETRPDDRVSPRALYADRGEAGELEAVAAVVERLCSRYPDVDPARVRDLVMAEHAALTGHRIRSYVPRLVEHQASSALRAETRAPLPDRTLQSRR